MKEKKDKKLFYIMAIFLLPTQKNQTLPVNNFHHIILRMFGILSGIASRR